jgi:flavin-binding protein dodecin
MKITQQASRIVHHPVSRIDARGRACQRGHSRLRPRRGRSVALPTNPGKPTMAVAKIIELKSASTKSIEDAVQVGVAKCAETVKNIRGAWVDGIKAKVGADGTITEWRVDLKVTFIVD